MSCNYSLAVSRPASSLLFKIIIIAAHMIRAAFELEPPSLLCCVALYFLVACGGASPEWPRVEAHQTQAEGQMTFWETLGSFIPFSRRTGRRSAADSSLAALVAARSNLLRFQINCLHVRSAVSSSDAHWGLLLQISLSLLTAHFTIKPVSHIFVCLFTRDLIITLCRLLYPHDWQEPRQLVRLPWRCSCILRQGPVVVVEMLLPLDHLFLPACLRTAASAPSATSLHRRKTLPVPVFAAAAASGFIHRLRSCRFHISVPAEGSSTPSHPSFSHLCGEDLMANLCELAVKN